MTERYFAGEVTHQRECKYGFVFLGALSNYADPSNIEKHLLRLSSNTSLLTESKKTIILFIFLLSSPKYKILVYPLLAPNDVPEIFQITVQQAYTLPSLGRKFPKKEILLHWRIFRSGNSSRTFLFWVSWHFQSAALFLIFHSCSEY